MNYDKSSSLKQQTFTISNAPQVRSPETDAESSVLGLTRLADQVLAGLHFSLELFCLPRSCGCCQTLMTDNPIFLPVVSLGLLLAPRSWPHVPLMGPLTTWQLISSRPTGKCILHQMSPCMQGLILYDKFNLTRLAPPTMISLLINSKSIDQESFCFNNSLFFKDFIYVFLDRGEEWEKERERNITVWLPLMCPLPRTWPATQACALTRNPTNNSLVHRPVLNPLSHTSQGRNLNCICDIPSSLPYNVAQSSE